MNRSTSEANGRNTAVSAFITQKGEKMDDMKKEIAELEQILAGTNQISQSTLLLKKRKEMREVDESLELMKEEYKRRMDYCEERRLLFEAKQVKMRDQVIKFEKFIQENDAKRQRAEIKTKQEKKIYDQRCLELKALEDKIKELEKNQAAILDELKLWSPYSEYLTSFVDSNLDQGFEEITDILKRYWTLRTSNETLMSQVQQQENEVDTIRSKLNALLTEKENVVLVNTSFMQQQQKVLDKVRIESKVVENGTERATESKKDSIRDLAQIIEGIRNLFIRCQDSNDKKTIKMNVSKESDILENLSMNLEVILAKCRDLIEITREYSGGGGRDMYSFAGDDLRGQSTSSVSTNAQMSSVFNKSNYSLK